MKNKVYSVTKDLEQRNPGKKFYSFMDMEDAEIRKKEVILPLPKKKGWKCDDLNPYFYQIDLLHLSNAKTLREYKQQQKKASK